MKNPLETNSPAKKMLIEFVKSPDNSEFSFVHAGDEAAAARFVQHMRVELARLRNLLRDRNIPVKPIKMLLRSYTQVDAGTRVILYKKVRDETLDIQVADLLSGLVSKTHNSDESESESEQNS